ncbi:hypothetical protein KM043_001836 [Ampulex compressa]|nr:hypothetical protein KM043_001836 [Ampulex compressa]
MRRVALLVGLREARSPHEHNGVPPSARAEGKRGLDGQDFEERSRTYGQEDGRVSVKSQEETSVKGRIPSGRFEMGDGLCERGDRGEGRRRFSVERSDEMTGTWEAMGERFVRGQGETFKSYGMRRLPGYMRGPV